jgi:hypothetical protein
MKKKGLYAGLTALIIMFFSFSAFAATMGVTHGDLSYVNFQYPGKSNANATEFYITLNDGVDWNDFFTTAYCVDLDNTIGAGTYHNVTFKPITTATDSNNFLHAAWLMDKWSADASGNANKTAGLQLAIWDAFYGDTFTNTTTGSIGDGSIGGYYHTYYQEAEDYDTMWSSLGYHYAYTTYTGYDAQSLLVQMNPVPEPGTMLLLGMGIAGLGAAGRKRFRKQ